MPEYPPNLSEPQYAALVFEHTCFVSNYVSQLLDLSPIDFRLVAPAERRSTVSNSRSALAKTVGGESTFSCVCACD